MSLLCPYELVTETRAVVVPYVAAIGTASQLHGVRELTQSRSLPVDESNEFFANLSMQSKLFWSLVFVLCLSMAIYGIFSVFQAYMNEKIVTSISVRSLERAIVGA